MPLPTELLQSTNKISRSGTLPTQLLQKKNSSIKSSSISTPKKPLKTTTEPIRIKAPKGGIKKGDIIQEIAEAAKNTLNKFGKKIGETQFINTPFIKSPTNLQVAQKVAKVVNQKSTPATSFLSGQVEKIPGQAKTTLTDSFGPPRKDETKEQYLARRSEVALGTVNFGFASPSFKQASKHLAERMGEGTKTSLFKELGIKAKNLKSVLKEKLVDSFSPIEDTINTIERKGKFKLRATEDPRLLRNRVLGSSSIAQQALKQNIEPVLKQIGAKDLDEFDKYLVARHSLDLTKKGITTGVDPSKAKLFVDTLSPKYEEAARQITGYTQKMLKYVADNGLISKETYRNLLEKYPNYIPMNRVMDELDDLAKITAIPGKSIGSLSKQTVVQGIKGSERQIESPLASIVDKTMNAIDQVERNRVAKSIANLRNVKGFEELITEVPAAKGKNTISAFIDGEKKFYEVPKEFAEAAKNLNVEQMDILTKILSIPVRAARLGITGVNLPFIATNVVRDQFFSILTSKKALKTTAISNPYNFIRSFLDVAGNKGAYDDFLASGGGSSNFFSVGKDASRVTVKELVQGRKSKISQTITNPLKLLSAIEDLVGVSEQTTRVQQFRGTRQALKEVGKVDAFSEPTEAGLKGLQAGRENTVDFAKKGAWGKVLNSAFIYLNAGIQGSRTALRSFKTNPVGTSVKLAATVYTPIAVTTLWNTATPERRQAYMDIPDYEKQNNLIVLPENPVLNDKNRYEGAIKIPLPQTFSALAVPIRSAIEHMGGAGTDTIPEALFKVLGGVSPIDFSSQGALISRATPTALVPVLEDYTNTKLFSGAPIVPRSKEGLEPSEQTSYDTSATMIEAGERLNISPAKMQNFVRGYTGEVGLQVLNAIDTAMNKAGFIPEEKVGGVSIAESILDRFTRVKGGLTEQEQYKEIKELTQKVKTEKNKEKERIQPIYDKVQKLKKDGKDDDAQRIVDKLSDDEWETYKVIKSTDKKRQTEELKTKMFSTVKRVQKLKKDGKKGEVQKIVDEMTDEEYDAYQKVKKQLGFE